MKSKSFKSKSFRPKGSPSAEAKVSPVSSSGVAPQLARASSVRGSSHSDIPRNWRVVVGDHAIRAAIEKSSHWIQRIWLKQGYESSQYLREIMDHAKKLKIPVEIKPDVQIGKVYPNNQGALVFVDGRPRLSIPDLEQFKTCILVALDGVEDPHNLGAILRTSWLTGVRGVLSPEDRSVGLSPTVHKVACGGVEAVPFEQLTQFHPTLEELKKQGFWVFGLSHNAKKSLFEVKIPEKIVWILGAEDKGLRSTTERACDELVSLPQTDNAASYNVSVAGGMTLVETLRQHQKFSLGKK